MVPASIIEVMSEQTPQTPESSDSPTDSFAPAPAPVAEPKTSKVHTALAWIGVIAGSLFIVATIFFSGFFMGAHAGGHHGCHKHHGKDSSQFRGDDHGRGWHHGPHGPGMWHPMGPGGPGNDDGPGAQGSQGAPGVPPAPAQPGR